MPYNTITPEILERIRAIDGLAVTAPGPDELGRDEGGLSAPCEAAVQATSAEQVSALLRLANEHRFPVTPRGTGTGIAGGAVPAHGGVVLSLAGMNRILDVDPVNMVAVVEPGVILKDLKEAALAKGLAYPPDPASLATCSVGGNAATNAGGPACVKYGVTRQYVLGLTAVLPTGEIIRTGSATRKHVVGYSLTHLLVGSEGTLGVITQLTLRLIAQPPARRALVAVFPDLGRAMRAVTAILTRGCTPRVVEFLDRKCLDLVKTDLPFGELDTAGAMLLLEADGAEAAVAGELEFMGRVCREHEAQHLLPANDPAQCDELWEIRRLASVRIHESWPVYISEDVAVPIGRIADVVEALPPLEAEHGVKVYAFGHCGDGNLHLNVTAARNDLRPRAEACADDLVRLVLGLGGTISGEHGIGLAKRRFVPLEVQPESLALQQAIKRLMDPNMILNPGKVLP